MSVRAITAAFALNAGSASNKSVLVALADHANDANECWPSISKLAEKTELHADTVKRCLRNLEQRGLIERTARYHDGTKYRRSDIYKLRLTSPHGATISPHGASMRGAPISPQDTTISPHGASIDTRTVQGIWVHGAGDIEEPSLKPSKEPSKEPSESRSVDARPARDFFAEFWAAYPKRDGSNPRKPALAKFQKLCRDGADPDQIIAGVKRYAEQEAKNVGTPYIKRAEHWLNQWSAEDDAPAVPAAQQHFVDKHETRSRFDAWYLHYLLNGDAVAINGMNHAAQFSRQGYPVPAEWPPNYDPAKRFPLRMVRQGATHQQNAWYAFFGERRATFMRDEFMSREISLPCEWPPGHQPAQSIADPQPQPIAA